MAWNQPNNNGDRDPWGSNNSSNNRGNQQGSGNGNLFDKINIFLGNLGKKGGSGGGSGSGNNNFNFTLNADSFKLLCLALLVALVGWFVSGIYTIQEGKMGVITRLGKVQSTLIPSGLHWKPTFIDKLIVVDAEWNRTFQTSGVMLTADENVVRVAMSVVFLVDNPINFLFSATDAENSLKQATDSALRAVIGKYFMERILTDGKAQISQDTQNELIAIVNNYNIGVKILTVNLENARPPDEVKAAFDDAISAREDEQSVKLQAMAYQNRVVPEAEGDVERLIENARAYKSKVVREAEGEAEQFSLLLAEYKKSPEIVRIRLYLDVKEKIMSRIGKVVVNGNDNIAIIPMDKMIGQAEAAEKVVLDAFNNGSATPMQRNNQVSPSAAKENSGAASRNSGRSYATPRGRQL